MAFFSRWLSLPVLLPLLAGYLLAATASAQAPPAREPASPDVRALIHENLKYQMPDGFMPYFRKDMTTRMVLRYQIDPAAVAAFVDEMMTPEFEAGVPDLENSLAVLWTNRFDATELHELAVGLKDKTPAQKQTFMLTPPGLKLMGKQPVINSELSEIVREWMNRRMRAVLANNAGRLRAIGINPLNGERLPAPAN